MKKLLIVLMSLSIGLVGKSYANLTLDSLFRSYDIDQIKPRGQARKQVDPVCAQGISMSYKNVDFEDSEWEQNEHGVWEVYELKAQNGFGGWTKIPYLSCGKVKEANLMVIKDF